MLHLGNCFFAMGVLTGEVEVGFFLIFPFLVGSGIYAFLGFICVFIAILLFIFGFGSTLKEPIDLQFKDDKQDVQSKKSVKGGGVVLIGPIPIVFGSNWKIAVLMMIIAIVLIITVFAFL